MVLIDVAEWVGKLWYRITAYVPRRLPTTPAQFERLRNVMISAYGVVDESASWITVVGAITSTPGHKLRKPWGHIANAAKRNKMNGMAMSFRHKYAAELEARLKAAIEAQVQAQEKADEQENAQEQPQASPHPSQALPENEHPG